MRSGLMGSSVRRAPVAFWMALAIAAGAGMIGGSRQSVNRLLADLTDQGLVRLERDHLVVADVERLARTVDR